MPVDYLHLARSSEPARQVLATYSQISASQLTIYILLAGIVAAVAVLLFAVRPWRSVAVRSDKAAKQRGDQLLRQHLSAAQYRQLTERDYLVVPSRLYPNRSYWIPYRPGRIQVYQTASETGVAPRPIGELCIVTAVWTPHADLILAQKWMIEADEQSYLTIANWMRDATGMNVQ